MAQNTLKARFKTSPLTKKLGKLTLDLGRDALVTFECKLSYVILLNDVTQPGVGFIHVCDQGAVINNNGQIII